MMASTFPRAPALPSSGRPDARNDDAGNADDDFAKREHGNGCEQHV
jgi:hypothetical protein